MSAISGALPASTTTPAALTGVGGGDLGEVNDLHTVNGLHKVDDLHKVIRSQHSSSLPLPAFCRLCWLAMQMPYRDSEQVYKFYQPSPVTVDGFREFVVSNVDRIKGIAYFDGCRRVDLAGVNAEQASVDKNDLVKVNVRKGDSNGSVHGIKDHQVIVKSNGHSKRQKAE